MGGNPADAVAPPPQIDIDVRTHLSWSMDETNAYRASPAALPDVMDRRNIRTQVNLTGGCGRGLEEAAGKFGRWYPGRFITFTKPWGRANEPEYPKLQADKVDDRRFDPMWEACGGLGLPVAIHISDPVAFFEPINRVNERFEGLHNHPDWSLHGKGFPGNMELPDARDRAIARHPGDHVCGVARRALAGGSTAPACPGGFSGNCNMTMRHSL
jgi:hypothetical protein